MAAKDAKNAMSAMQKVNVETAMQSAHPRGIDYGSLVEVRTLDNQRARFRVTEISREGLGGRDGFYRYEDMKSLRVENPNAGSDSTWHYILGALGIAALVALALSADSVAVGSSGAVVGVCTEGVDEGALGASVHPRRCASTGVPWGQGDSFSASGSSAPSCAPRSMASASFSKGSVLPSGPRIVPRRKLAS